MPPARRRLLTLLARLDRSPLRPDDPLRLHLEGELLDRLALLRVLEDARWGRLLGARHTLALA